MNEEILCIADRDLSRRIELCDAWRGVRYAEIYARLHPEAGSAVQPVGGGYAIYVSHGSPVNSARGLGLAGPISPDQVQAFEDFYLSRGESPRLRLSPFADESLVDLLGQRGYVAAGFFNTLVRFIPTNYTPAKPPGGLLVTQAGPDDDALWIHTVAEGFEGTPSPSPAAFNILEPNFYAADSLAFFAWAVEPSGERQPAGGGGMYLCPRERAVELGGASTRLPYRKRGAQTTLIEARLAAARQAGCDLAMVLTEPGSGSQRNLLRAGFWLAYTSAVVHLRCIA